MQRCLFVLESMHMQEAAVLHISRGLCSKQAILGKSCRSLQILKHGNGSFIGFLSNIDFIVFDLNHGKLQQAASLTQTESFRRVYFE